MLNITPFGKRNPFLLPYQPIRATFHVKNRPRKLKIQVMDWVAAVWLLKVSLSGNVWVLDRTVTPCHAVDHFGKPWRGFAAIQVTPWKLPIYEVNRRLPGSGTALCPSKELKSPLQRGQMHFLKFARITVWSSVTWVCSLSLSCAG